MKSKNKIINIFKKDDDSKDNFYNNYNINEKIEYLDEDYEEGIENISIDEIDKEVEKEFFLDQNRIDELKAPEEMKTWVKDAIERVEKEKKIEKRKKAILGMAASITVILSVGVYNPALAHNMPTVEKILKEINKTLKVDEIAAITGIDSIIPKATVDKDNKIKFVKPSNYKINKIDGESTEKDEIDVEENAPVDVNEIAQKMPVGEYESVQFIHKMANTIIKAGDNRKYGEIQITPTNIKIAQAVVKNINNIEAQNYLNNELHKWSEGNFDNGVAVHNYVWHMLDGEIGKAISLDYERIESIKNIYFK